MKHIFIRSLALFAFCLMANGVTGAVRSNEAPAFDAFAEVKIKDGQSLQFSVQSYHAADVKATGLPKWLLLRFDAATGIASVSGTPNIGGPYPIEYPFTLTATPAVEGEIACTIEGKVTVMDPETRMLLLACKDLSSVSEDPVAAQLSGSFDVTLRKQDELAGSSIESFDLIVVSENADADDAEILRLIREGDKPLLNLNGFTYTKGRLNWGDPDNGTIDPSVNNHGCHLWVQRADHPIFSQLGWQKGEKVQVLTEYEKKGLMPISISRQGTLCLASSYTRNPEDYYLDGEMQTILHEVPSQMRGGGKYICFPLARTVTLSDEGKRMVDVIADYLLGADEMVITTPRLEISRFEIEGHTAEIDQTACTITLSLTTTEYQELDSLRAVRPIISLADEVGSFVSPCSEEEVSLMYATLLPYPFVVTDFINHCVYSFSVQLSIDQSLANEREPQLPIHIYDIYGRKIISTQEDIRSVNLPHGMYLIVTAGGSTFKIMK